MSNLLNRGMSFSKYMILFLQIGFSIHYSFAQTYSGFVRDKETHLPIPYANIGIIDRNIGTVSEEDGSFEVQLDTKYDTDSLRFSSIGYESQTYRVQDFRNHFSSNKITINLSVKATLLHEVLVTSGLKKLLVLGNPPKSKFTKTGFFYNRKGHEMGSLFERASSSPLYIDSVQLNFATCNYDSIFLRLNVYNIDGERIENILPKNVFVNLTKKEALANPIIDLSSYDLLVGEKYLVSIEMVKDLGELGLKFYAVLKVDKFPALYRGTSQDKWQRVYHKSKPVGISIITYSH
jgi:hypothetical protein